MFKILVLNMGGTSTKLAIYEDEALTVDHVIRHTNEDIHKYVTSREQVDFRKRLIFEWFKENDYKIENFSCVAIMGATIPEAKKSGTYLVSGKYKEEMLKIFRPDERPIHGNRMIAALTFELIGDKDIPVYITDPPSVDELSPVARVMGVRGYERRAAFHALSQKATAKKIAKELGKPYDECRIVVAHMGGGISVAAHDRGQIVDVNDTGEGDGPFTPQRAGTVPTFVMLDLCYDKGLSRKETHRRIRGDAGLMGLLGTESVYDIEQRIKDGDKYAELVLEAMAYQVAKEIGACAAVLEGKCDAIGITGGIAYSQFIMDHITRRVSAFGAIKVYPGECENEALALGAYRVLSGKEEALTLG